MIWIIVPVILVVSFLLALRSLKKELQDPREINDVKKELMKEKVLFVKED